MNDHYLYLLINLLSVIFPFLFSFHPKIGLHRMWKELMIAIIVPAVLFILWDMWFTQMEVWSFNPRYVTGLYLYNLPVEEVLFFLCIPYASFFIYHLIGYSDVWKKIEPARNFITDLLIFGLLILAALHHTRWYTAFTFFSTAGFLIFLRRVWMPDFLGKFYFSFLFILIPFFLVNGILTGTGLDEPVVLYNDFENLGIRIGTIPVEDIFYGMLLLLMNVSVFELMLAKKKAR